MPQNIITTDFVDIGKSPTSLDSSKEAPEYTGVRIFVGTNSDGQQVAYEAGDNTGMVLEISNPFGTEPMANAILEEIRGFRYQPMKISRGLLDPAAEMGDGIAASTVYGGMYKRTTTFGSLMASDIEAPFSEEIEHEYGVGNSPTDRKFVRLEAQYKSSLKITNGRIESEVSRATNAENSLSSQITQTAGEIAAKVSKKSPEGQTSFSWNLTDSDWSVKSNGSTVLQVNSGGLTVTGSGTFSGTITATGGYIGSSSSGFTINTSYIANGKESLTDSNNGVYIGTDGIALGASSAFKVDSNGNLYAQSGTFSGNVNAGSILSGTDMSGVSHGYFDGDGLSTESVYGGENGKIDSYTVSTYNVTDGISDGVYYGQSYGNAIASAGATGPVYFNASSIYCTNLFADTNIVLGDYKLVLFDNTSGIIPRYIVTWTAYGD